jgi:hypothetical protein
MNASVTRTTTWVAAAGLPWTDLLAAPAPAVGIVWWQPPVTATGGCHPAVVGTGRPLGVT